MTPYVWAERLEAYCFTAVVGLHPDEAVRRLGADPTAAQERTFDECFWAADGPQWAQIDTVDGGVLVAEHNGWRAEEAVESLSVGTSLACFFRNVHAVMHFIYAINGAVIAEFDPLLEPGPRSSVDHPGFTTALRGLPFGLFNAEVSALILLERLTGIAIRPTWLASRHRAVQLPPLR